MPLDKYHVLVLGGSGAGKTVYLAMLASHLGIQGEAGFYLKVNDYKQENRLLNIATEVADTSRPWPPGTRRGPDGITRWEFTCGITHNGRNVDGCRFSYMDYSGGDLPDPQDVPQELIAEIDQAELFIGIIDGFRLYRYLKGGDAASDKVFLRDLQKICLTMDRAGNSGRQRPAHLIITKWDILEKEYKFPLVREKMMSSECVRNLARNRGKVRMRLIPVTAVGSAFARITDDGNIQKIVGQQPAPVGLEWPMACVLPDLVHREVEMAKARLEKTRFGRIKRWLGIGLTHTPDLADLLPPGKYRIIARPIARALAGLGHQIERPIIKIEKEIDALEHVARAMILCQQRMDVHFGKDATLL